ncbi:hypothetical protein [Levilactobacillus yonginensis]|uniref:hypothetical protein n=1 Tax=Levilactobacillus yonginensis TaxID=1054041 RepID=UPI00345DA963
MRSSFAKSIYVGAAVLGLAGLSAVTTTTASAKSYATAGAYSKLTTDATKRNVEATGTNALYTKPGTVKGAKVVASKATMAKLASSKKSADYFRAYGVKTTNRGSVYYRVVTMDQKYRGYVYGGKVADTFGGGIKAAETTTANTTDSMIGKTVTFTNPGTKNVTWTAPKYTQYKSGASKVVKNTTPFAGDTLKVTKAETKTREGSLYYYVEDQQNPTVNGWIYSKAVTTDTKVAFNQATDVKVNFTNDGKTVASGVLQNLLADSTKKAANAVGTAVGTDATAKATTWVDTKLQGTGYTYDKTSNANAAALLAAKTGDTITLSVNKGTTVTSTIFAYGKENGTDTKSNPTVTFTKLSSLSATQIKSYTNAVAAAEKAAAEKADYSSVNYKNYGSKVVLPSLTTGFSGTQGAGFTSADLTTFANNNKLGTLYSPTFYVAKSGDNAEAVKGQTPVKAYVKYTLTSANKGTYGDKAQLFYTAETVYGSDSPVKVTANTGNAIFG